MRKFEPLQWFMQRRIDERDKQQRARVLAEAQKEATARFNAFYEGKSSFRDEVDTKELNSYMELD